MTGVADALPVRWTTDFIVIDGELPSALAFDRLSDSTERWVVIDRYGGMYLYAFLKDELFHWPALDAARARGDDFTTLPFERALDLHEELQSTKTPDRSVSEPIDRSWREGFESPSIDRYIEIAADGTPRAIGVTGNEPIDKKRTARAKPPMRETQESVVVPPAPVPPEPSPEPAPVARAIEDEGTTPIRFPSIEPNVDLVPGDPVSFTVDLLRELDARTEGGAVTPGRLDANWSSIDLSVTLACADITFDPPGQGTVTVRRNAASEPAHITGRVSASVAVGAKVLVEALFYLGTRFCGSARRSLTVGANATAAATQEEGRIAVEPSAAAPDLTVHISVLDKNRPGSLYWQLITERFDGLPPSLAGTIDLGNATATEAAALFKRFATLERGKHSARIEAFGDELWLKAPQVFRDVYWALWDRYRRALRIQFISDDPHIPWELMRPVRADESELHPPLALKHPVARWIKQWDGYMRNSIPAGPIFTIAPKYQSVSRALPRAQAEAQLLVSQFQAKPVQGTLGAVDALLSDKENTERVAILHFAGHGTFSPDVATDASIKLEDGELTASEVGRVEVQLGKHWRTIVFFNACEVGATGAVFGQVGGWADALLRRQFGGFIAPLWAVDDEDASVVATELMEGIVRRQLPVGDVLRELREKHGATSPTFYSYLYYGDVTAHLQV